jgi:cell division protein FtsL
MLRFFNICLCLALVVLAYVIYQVKYDTRTFDVDIASLSKEIEAERDSVAVLRAEWSLLNRPERIERLAQKYLDLAPPKPRQMLALETASPGDLERASAELAAPALPPLPAVAKAPPKPASKPAQPASAAQKSPKPAKIAKPSQPPRPPIQAAAQ